VKCLLRLLIKTLVLSRGENFGAGEISGENIGAALW
jgi:hypothetical protein